MRRAPVLAVLWLLTACSPASMGMNRMADALSQTASAYARDDDPEFVRVGAPSTLKMVEMMLERNPAHHGLLETACGGFAQYAFAFLQVDSEILAETDARAAAELAARAAQMYRRARSYCVRALGIRHGRLAGALDREPPAALPLLAATRPDDVPALYWAAVAWGGEIAVSESQLVRIGELPVIRALLTRALALDEHWSGGAIHEAMIAFEGLPTLLGGSSTRAREHFDRAVALSGGTSAFAYVTLASSVALPARDREQFEMLLRQALAIDASDTPGLRLANLIAQRRARHLLAQAEGLFK